MDVILVGFVAGMTFAGWRTGFVRRAAGLALHRAVVRRWAHTCEGPFGDLVNHFFPDMPADYAALLGYAFAFPVILALLHVVAHPFLKDRHVGSHDARAGQGAGRDLRLPGSRADPVVIVVIFDTYFVLGVANGGAAGFNPLNGPGLSTISGLVAAFNESYTVHLLRQTTVPLVLAVLGPLLPKNISSLIPGGIPGLPGMPGLAAAGTARSIDHAGADPHAQALTLSAQRARNVHH